MLDVFNIAKPQNCDIQMFYGGGLAGTSSTAKNTKSWVKPRGTSNIYMMLIGPGGDSQAGTSGGGSGAVTVWYGAAQNVPDNLIIAPGSIAFVGGTGDAATNVYYQGSSATLITLLSANKGSNSGAGGTAMTANQFAASGFFQSIAGQTGSTADPGTSSTTFLSGGGNNPVTANYGYIVSGTAKPGFFQLQPIIVGVGGSGISPGGIGCGGGYNATTNSAGGPGMVLIASW